MRPLPGAPAAEIRNLPGRLYRVAKHVRRGDTDPFQLPFQAVRLQHAGLTIGTLHKQDRAGKRAISHPG